MFGETVCLNDSLPFMVIDNLEVHRSHVAVNGEASSKNKRKANKIFSHSYRDLSIQFHIGALKTRALILDSALWQRHS